MTAAADVTDAPIASRTDVINLLVRRFGLERYLEIGLADGGNFAQVVAPQRHSVDPAGSPTFAMASDQFFAAGLGFERYDLVFVDGFHEAEQCLRDIENALGRLSPSGFIVVHDVDPPTEWHQRPPEEYAWPSEWNGTVWKAFVRFRQRHPELAAVTVDVDWGCGVICRGRGAAVATPIGPVDPAGLSFGELQRNRSGWLNLVSPDQFRQIVRGMAP